MNIYKQILLNLVHTKNRESKYCNWYVIDIFIKPNQKNVYWCTYADCTLYWCKKHRESDSTSGDLIDYTIGIRP